MPWTFAHPAAVLPLRRFCPRWLNWPALVVRALALQEPLFCLWGSGMPAY